MYEVAGNHRSVCYEKREETRTEKNRGGAIKFFIWGLSPFYVRPTAPPTLTFYIYFIFWMELCVPPPPTNMF